jgi:hypothetical protein
MMAFRSTNSFFFVSTLLGELLMVSGTSALSVSSPSSSAIYLTDDSKSACTLELVSSRFFSTVTVFNFSKIAYLTFSFMVSSASSLTQPENL